MRVSRGQPLSVAIIILFLAFGFRDLLADPPPVVINELHIDEDDKTKRAEFIELHNHSTAAVDISGWFFSSGIDYTIPATTSIPANGYVVVAMDPSGLQSEFGYVGALGPWTGKLSNVGERITLRDSLGSQVDEVDYQLGFPWPTFGDPPSPSMELINPDLDNNLAGSWRSSGNVPAVSVPAADYILREQTWSYRKGTSFPLDDASARNWTENGYDVSVDGEWLSGQTPIGFGDGDDNTVLTDMQGNYISIFLRKEFTIAAGQVPNTLKVKLHYDDGAVVWINGTEVVRTPAVSGGPVPFPPPNGFTGGHEVNKNDPAIYDEFQITGAQAFLVEGTNTIAIQQFNTSTGSSDASIDAELITERAVPGSFTAADPSPGSPNSVFANNAPPAMRQVDHTPKQPVSSDAVTVTMKITDSDGIAAVNLEYQLVDPGDYIAVDDPRFTTQWTSVPMFDDGSNGDVLAGDDVFTAVLPASLQSHRRLVRYRVNAVDALGASSIAPHADDPQPNFAYFVYDGIPAWTGRATPSSPNVTYDFNALPPLQQNVAVYHLVTTRTHHVDAQYIPSSSRGSGYTGSDYLWSGALVYDGKVYDHIRYRARGGVWRFAMGKNMWKFDFNRGHRFQAFDDYGRKYSTVWDKLNFSALIQQGNFGQRGEQGIFEGAGFRLHSLAGNPGSKTHYAHFRIIENAAENGNPGNQFDSDFQGIYMAVEQMDGQFLEEHDLPDGNLYKMESGTGTLNNQGPDLPSNKSDLNAFMGAYNGGTPSQAFWEDNLVLDDYYNFYAIITAIHDNDIHAGKNYFFFHRPADPLDPHGGKWQVLNWDLDLCWTTTYRLNNPPDGPIDQDVFAHSNLRRDYRNRMREIRDLLFNPEQTGMLIDEVVQFIHTPGVNSYAAADRAMWDYNPILTSRYVNSSKAGHGRFYQATGPRTFAAMIDHVKNYIVTRGNYIDNTVLTDDNQVPNKPALSYSGLAGFPANAISVTSSAFGSPSGSGFSAMQYRVAEITDTESATFDPAIPRKYEIEADWTSVELTAFTPSQPIPATAIRPGRTYRARVRHKDAAGRWSHWSDPVQFLATAPDVSEFQQNLMISEFMFNPPAPTGPELSVSTNNDDYEFVELTNIGTSQLVLTDVRFTKGVDFDFPAGTVLDAGASILVVKNEAAFAARYGEGLPVAGNYEDGNLANDGEQLKLSLGAGTPIHDFVYDDASPWPVAADGLGYSLVLVDPGSAPDHSVAANWRISSSPGGSPGTEDGVSYAVWKAANGITDDQGDNDGDGLVNLLEFFFGFDPNGFNPGADPVGEVLSLDGGSGAIDEYLTLTFRRRIGIADVDFAVEFSGDLDNWSAIPAVFVQSTPNGDGTVTDTWRADTPASNRESHFVRLRVNAQP